MDLEISGQGITDLLPTETDYIVATLVNADVDAILKQIPAEDLAQALAKVDPDTTALSAIRDDLEFQADNARRSIRTLGLTEKAMRSSIALLEAQKAHTKAQRDSMMESAQQERV